MGPFEGRPFQLELPGNLAALPVRLTAVAHQEFQGGLVRQKWIVLAQIGKAQVRMANDLAAVELLFAEQHTQQRALACPVSPNEADIDIVAQGRVCTVE